MTLEKRSVLTSTIAAFSFSLVAGCSGATNPSPQLYDAQRAYQRAAASRASELAPDRLLTARETLDRAKAAEPGSAEEQELSYLASRRARMAEVYADYLHDNQELGRARSLQDRAQRERRARAEEDLDRARKQLVKTQHNLAASSAELRARTTEVVTLESQLDDTESKRQAAEKRADDAMRSLQEVANVRAEATETVITLSGAVLFVTGQSELLPIAREKLDRVAAALADSGDDEHIVIAGFTDSRGSRTKNQKLSLDRANAVRDYLVSHGVAPQRVEARGYGPDQPVADNSTPEGRADNRRVEIHIQKKH